MSHRYQHLLSPLRVGKVTLKSRVCYPDASPHFLNGPEYWPGEGFMTFYTNLAKNGCAYIDLGLWSNPRQRIDGAGDSVRMQNFDYSDPAVTNYFSQLADDARFYGSEMCVCLTATYPEGYTFGGGGAGMMGNGGPTTPIPEDMMPDVIAKFVEKADMFRDCGYRMCSVNIGRFMDKWSNLRTDAYGCQNPENAARFAKRLCKAVKDACGYDDFLIEAVCYGEKDHTYTTEFLGQVLLELQPYIDIVMIKEKDAALNHPTGYNFYPGLHPNLAYARQLKAMGIRCPIALNGGYQDPDEMERYLKAGDCDLFSISRGMMADPNWGEKVQAQRGEDVTPCLWCNKCHGVMHGPWISFCSVNPLLGDEHKLHRLVKAPGAPKKVAVVGGGPIGMRTAIYAAQRGHSVTLFEKTDKLGGQIYHSEYAKFKWPLKEYKDWLIRQLGVTGVTVQLNTLATPEAIAAQGFDTVVACTGAVANIPNIPGLKNPDGSRKPGFYTILEAFGNADKLGDNIIIVGGSEAGAECGMYLCAEGKKSVIVLTRQREIAADASKVHGMPMAHTPIDENGHECVTAAYGIYDSFIGVTHASTLQVTPTSVTFRVEHPKQGDHGTFLGVMEGMFDATPKGPYSADGEYTLQCDNVIICGGMTSCNAEALSFYDSAQQYFMAGDCDVVADLQKGNRAAFAKASQI